MQPSARYFLALSKKLLFLEPPLSYSSRLRAGILKVTPPGLDSRDGRESSGFRA
jgi:hypothetical protein